MNNLVKEKPIELRRLGVSQWKPMPESRPVEAHHLPEAIENTAEVPNNALPNTFAEQKKKFFISDV